MLLSAVLSVGLASLGFVYGSSSLPSAEYEKIKSLKEASSAKGSECACNILTGLFESKSHQPESAVYTTESTHHWDTRANALPKCVFVPTTADEVAQAVVTLNMCKSQFAIRGAGHMPVGSVFSFLRQFC